MSQRKKIAVVIPTYNEKRLTVVVQQVLPFADKVIVVDDGSTEEVDKINSRKVVILRHAINLGQGAALQTGFEYALSKKMDIVVTFDADGQFLASEIPMMAKPIKENRAQISLGSRFLGRTVNIPLIRRLILKTGIIFTYLFSDIKLTDTYNGFRAISREALQKIKITQNEMAHASEIIDNIKKFDLKFIEVPVTIIYDEYSLKKKKGLENILRILFDLISKKLLLK